MLKQPEFRKVKFGQIRPWEKNPRNIKKERLERLAKSIKEKGLFQTLTCWKEGSFYITGGGNMRWQAMKHILKWPDDREVWISINFPENEKEKIELSLLDNMRFGQYIEQELAELTYPYIDEIELEEFDIDLKEPVNLKNIIEDFGPDLDGEDEDEIPEIDDSPALTKYGDLYQLGRHRLLCGDATKEGDVKRLMGGKKANMVFTDPPYNVQIDYGEHKDNYSLKEYKEFSLNWLNKAKDLSKQVLFTPGTGRGLGMPNLQMWYEIAPPDWIIIWIKKNAVGHSSLGGFNNWEPIFFYGKPKKKLAQDIYDIPITVQSEIIDDMGEKQHPTPKQLKLWSRIIFDLTESDDTCLDFFLGSGTTLIACEKLNRICYGMEIEPKYCDVIITRYSNFTGIPEEEIRATKR